ncbi:TonB-dependent receptor [Aestuariivivens insulae]|uniref:TonB-dependent receptor n=1 Tax=Aestuariivivens insulae TaxID=1621988 RepID=UPI001F5A5BCC|nr:TonB-dependent receptor [Aestuariivivens insulae]
MKKNQHFFSGIPILRIMKIYLILLCVTLTKIFASEAYSQSITLNAENTRIKKILAEIEQKSEFSFFYNSSIVNVGLKKSLAVEDVEINDALRQLFEDTNIDFSFLRNQIILFPKDRPELKLKIENLFKEREANITSSLSPTKVKEYLHSVLQTSVSGQVVDANGNPLPGVTILVKGTSKGATTDFDGNYSISANSPDDILVFSYVGFATQEVSINDRAIINVTMSESTSELDEVVIIGYGTQKKVNLTGSVATIKSDEIVKNSTSNISSALSGRLAGVITIQSSGEPGSDAASIRVRGLSSLNSNSPLILVDGIPRSLNNINSNDIENISVLKDAAAAAIYGMRAANGVILITTKRGKGKTSFNVNIYSGVQKPTRMPNFLDSYDYATLLNEANANDGVAAAYTDEDLQKFRDGSSPDTHPNTDWIDEVLDSSSSMHSIDISASGSNTENTIKYFTSLGYLYQDAIYDNNNYDRFNFRSNLDIDINENMLLQANFSGAVENRKRPGISAGTLFSNLMRTPPTEVNRYSNGGYSIFALEPSINSGGYREEEDFDFQSKIALNIKFPFLEGLSLITQVAYDRSAGGNNNNRDNFTGSVTSFTVPKTYTVFNPSTGEFSLSTPGDRGETASLSESRAKGYQLTTEAILNYSKTINKHDFGAKFVYSRTESEYSILSSGISNLTGTSTPLFVAGDAETRSISNGTFKTAILGYAGRFTYGYDNKYLLEFNGRYDGSYKFSKASRFGFFPSYSLAWRASEEKFLQDSETISNLKLRFSYGELGSDSGVGAFRYLEFFGFGGPFVDDSSVAQTISSSGLADPGTTWEKAKTYNLGLELGLWNNALSIEADVYAKRTTDILTTRSLQVPSTFGASLPYENIGVVDNKGFEIIINHTGQGKDFDYFTNFNFGYATNKVVDIAEAEDVDPLRRLTGRQIRAQSRIGFIAEGLFLTQQEIDDLNAAAPDGVYQTQNPQPGDIKYADLNGDGKVDNDDRTFIGKIDVPEITFGLNLGFNYKQFDFSALFQGAANFDMYLSQESAWAFFNGGKVFGRHLDRAQIGTDGNVINSNASYPRLTLINNAVNERFSSYWLVPGDYIRFKNVEIGYNFPQGVLDKLGINKLRVYLNGRNLATWSKIKHLDPENPQARGWFYPQQKVYNLGVNLQF